jgi:hypothetical protein
MVAVKLRRCGLSLGVVIALFAGSSCTKPKEALLPVAGTITVNKRPLASGTVVFHPDRDKGNKDPREPRATIGSDPPGGYRLQTDDQDGAPAGWYKVTVYALKTPQSSVKPPEWLAHQKYTNEKSAGLSVEVVKDATAHAYDFELDPPD